MGYNKDVRKFSIHVVTLHSHLEQPQLGMSWNIKVSIYVCEVVYHLTYYKMDNGGHDGALIWDSVSSHKYIVWYMKFGGK